MHLDRSELAAVFAGGFLGAIARAALAEELPAGACRWPRATFVVNVVGALLLGWVATWMPPDGWRQPLLGEGVCGALTTFSTMQLELLEMLDGEHYALAAGYALGSVAAGLCAAAVATVAARRRSPAP